MHFLQDELHYEFIIGKLAARGGGGSGTSCRGQMFNGGGSLVAQVLEQDVAELASGAAAQRIQDRFVLAHGLAPALPLAREIGGITDASDPAGKTGVGRVQGLVACGRNGTLVGAPGDL